MYEIFPIAAGVIIGFAVARGGRQAIAIGMGLAVAAGITVAFASGEWREGVIYLIWDSFQAVAVCALTIVAVRRFSSSPSAER